MENEADFQYQYFSAVSSQKVEWLWYPYIPYGKLTILQGDPGEGKSTFILNIAALLTRGSAMPDGYPVTEPQAVVYQTAEDNISDTVKPRLIAAGADCSKVAYIVDEENPLTLEDNRIEKILAETGARLFILDPLQAYLSADSDMVNVGRMRTQLKKLVVTAARFRCAIVIVGHMNKSSGEKNLYRGLGSIDIAAIARSVLMISRDENNPDIRLMFPVKASLAPEGKPIAFSLDPAHVILWLGQKGTEEEKINSFHRIDKKMDFATQFLRENLKNKDMPSTAIIRKITLFGISERTLNIAKKNLGIETYRKNGAWHWHLPEE